MPCVHCRKRDLECHYSPQRRRGYKPKASKSGNEAEPPRESVTYFNAAAEAGLSLSSVKAVLLDMYFRHFHRFSFNLVTQSAITNPTNAAQELAQTAALALAARALRLNSVRHLPFIVLGLPMTLFECSPHRTLRSGSDSQGSHYGSSTRD